MLPSSDVMIAIVPPIGTRSRSSSATRTGARALVSIMSRKSRSGAVAGVCSMARAIPALIYSTSSRRPSSRTRKARTDAA